MTRNWWIWTLVGLMAIALILGALLNFTSAFWAIPILFVVLIAGVLLGTVGAARDSYEPPEDAKATGHRLPRSPSHDR